MSESGNGRERELHIGFGRAPGHLLIIAEMRASRDPSPGYAITCQHSSGGIIDFMNTCLFSLY